LVNFNFPVEKSNCLEIRLPMAPVPLAIFLSTGKQIAACHFAPAIYFAWD
jgi:hypothetical protein